MSEEQGGESSKQGLYIGVFLVGCLALLASTAMLFLGGGGKVSAAEQALAVTLEGAQRDLRSAEQALAVLNLSLSDIDMEAGKWQGNLDQEKSVQSKLAADRNRTLGGLRETVEALKNPVAAPVETPAENVTEDLQSMLKSTSKLVAVVTYPSQNGESAGFLFDYNRMVWIVTICPFADAPKNMSAFLSNTDARTNLRRWGSVKIQGFAYDKKSRLLFLATSLRPGDPKLLAPSEIKGVKLDVELSQAVYMVSPDNAAVADKDVCLFDGTVSMKDRQYLGITGFQTTLPANALAAGSPVVQADGKLIGAMLGKMGDLDHTCFVIPVKEFCRILESELKRR